MKQIKSTTTKTTPIQLGDKVTFIGDLPGGYYDNYSGYSKRGNMFGVVIKIHKVNADISMKDGSVFRVEKSKLTNIEDLF